MATKKARTKSRSRGAKKVSVRDLAPKNRKGAVKGGLGNPPMNFSKVDLGDAAVKRG